MIATRIGRRRTGRVALTRGQLLGHRTRPGPSLEARHPHGHPVAIEVGSPVPIAGVAGTMRDTGPQVAPQVHGVPV